MPRVSGSMSQKRIRAPWRAKARALLVKVNDGTTTVSPGPRPSSRQLSSRASVHEVVSSTSSAPVTCCRSWPVRFEKGPPLEVCPLASASPM